MKMLTIMFQLALNWKILFLEMQVVNEPKLDCFQGFGVALTPSGVEELQ